MMACADGEKGSAMHPVFLFIMIARLLADSVETGGTDAMVDPI